MEKSRISRSVSMGVPLSCLPSTPKRTVIRGYGAWSTRTASLYDDSMFATTRDHEIVHTIGRFKQLSSGHVRDLIFHENLSDTPAKRSLKRLAERGYLKRIERRLIGGTGAGSGQYVYQLGPLGWKITGMEGRYWPARSIDYHTLAIADSYVSLRIAERAGMVNVLTYENEPETWRELAGVQLTPDLYLELELLDKAQRLALWVEVDLGTERQSVIKDKFARYWHAYQHAELEVFPLVLFLTPDQHRSYDLKRWLQAGNDEARALFVIAEQTRFPSLFL